MAKQGCQGTRHKDLRGDDVTQKDADGNTLPLSSTEVLTVSFFPFSQGLEGGHGLRTELCIKGLSPAVDSFEHESWM